MTHTRLRPLVAVLLLDGCAASDGGGNDTAATTATGGSSAGDDAPCEPGSPGCPCANGMCLDPLVCMDDVCTWLPPPTTTATTDAESSTSADSGSESGPSTCSDDGDCPSIFEFCQSDGACTDIREAAYQVTVPSWSPGIGCGGGTFEGDADLYWQLKLGGVAVAQSSWLQGGCPGNWPGETLCIQPGLFSLPFFIGAWDEDGDVDSLQDSLWWDDDGNTIADPIDPRVLLEGYDGATGSGGHVQIDFVRVDACE